MKIELKDVLHSGSEFEISLSKLTGKKIVDVIGCISMEFGFPVFEVSSILCEDGLEINLQGEHDIAFIPQGSDSDMPPNMDEETMYHLSGEE